VRNQTIDIEHSEAEHAIVATDHNIPQRDSDERLKQEVWKIGNVHQFRKDGKDRFRHKESSLLKRLELKSSLFDSGIPRTKQSSPRVLYTRRTWCEGWLFQGTYTRQTLKKIDVIPVPHYRMDYASNLVDPTVRYSGQFLLVFENKQFVAC